MIEKKVISLFNAASNNLQEYERKQLAILLLASLLTEDSVRDLADFIYWPANLSPESKNKPNAL